MFKKLMLVSMLTIISTPSFAEELAYPVGRGDLFIFNDSQNTVAINNHLIGENSLDLGAWQHFPTALQPKQVLKISLTENLSPEAVRLIIETNAKGVDGFIFDAKEGEFFAVTGGIKQASPRKGTKLIEPPKNFVTGGNNNE